MWLLVIAIVPLVLLLFVFFFVFPRQWNWPSFEWKMAKIPGPRTIPFFGNCYSIITSKNYEYLSQITNYVNNYQPIVNMHLLGFHKVIITDCEDIEILLNNRSNIAKSTDYNLLLPWLGTGLLISTGEKWFQQRRMLTPAFHYGIIDEYIDIFSRNAAILIGNIPEGLPVEINPLVCFCTLDIICETAMGTKINAQQGKKNDYVQAVLEMSSLFQQRQLNPFIMRQWTFNLSATGRRQKKVLNILHSFTGKVISERTLLYRRQKKRGELDENTSILGAKKRKSFLDVLIEASESEGLSLTEEEMRNEVDTFMFEGHDTTAAAISWALFELGHNPNIQKTAQEELDQIFADDPSREIQLADLSKMKYLERVIKETLRLYPSVPIMARKVEKAITIKGYEIPAGADVAIFVYYLHRDPKLYLEPEKFNPDRFLPEAISARHPYSYIPFSAGPRNCIGQRFALAEEKVVLAEILRKFHVQSLDRKEDVKFLAELILRPVKNLNMKFTYR